MNTTTAAQIAKVTVATIRNWCRIGAVAATKTAGKWDIDAASLGRRNRIAKDIAAARKARRDARIILSVDTLTAIGGSRWTKAGKDRVYINDWAALAGLEYTTYGTGNISSATYQGEDIANRQAGLALGAIDKVWFDTADGQLHVRYGYSEPRFATREQLWDNVTDGIRAAVAAL